MARTWMECNECGAHLRPDSLEDPDMDQCPDCGQWTSFDQVFSEDDDAEGIDMDDEDCEERD